MSASSRSISSTRGRIIKQPPTPAAAVNAGACETSNLSIPEAASEDPNIAAATSALIFPQSHGLFESSPHRPRQTSSQRSRSSRRQSQNKSSTSSRHTIQRKPVSDHEVSEILRNDGFQERHRSPSASRPSTVPSADLHGSQRSRQTTASSRTSTRQTRSFRERAMGNEELTGIGEWGEAIPTRPRDSSSSHDAEDKGMDAIENDDQELITPRASSESTNAARRSRFVEGTMNMRSMGVASTWYNDTKNENDAGRLSMSPSKDVDFSQVLGDRNKPLPAVPSPKSTKRRRGMFRFGGHKEDEGQEINDRRKGLRSSRSIFNFKLFNTDGGESKSEPTDSQTTATPKPAKYSKISKKKALSETEAQTNLLNERKRKAEEAYAEQFGFKKRQKYHAEDSANKPPTMPSASIAATATTPLTAFKQSKDKSGPPSAAPHNPKLQGSASSRSLRAVGPALRKRPSRKDLEDENAKLRALLALERERNNSISVNGDPHKDHLVKSPVGGNSAKFGDLENIPPVPRLPGKGALQLLEGYHLRSRAKIECLSDEQGDGMAGKSRGAGMKESFEWPDDVF